MRIDRVASAMVPYPFAFTLISLFDRVNLSAGERKLMKKSRKRLIHVSDFVEEENGRLVVHDKDGNITRNTRKIIYPGSNRDV